MAPTRQIGSMVGPGAGWQPSATTIPFDLEFAEMGEIVDDAPITGRGAIRVRNYGRVRPAPRFRTALYIQQRDFPHAVGFGVPRTMQCSESSHLFPNLLA